ncbi:transcriptional regulator, GntR family [Nocardioides scoriae]|uniref:Transcriptional regulator, GntR family n=1 Tax=Nocardioides scoriae TaxID=642780 RepID=A0A1H1QAE6_9ACTN|nr:FCD domain-containing protein [Nocardioides scoriae]SDS20354.1 transcriptional regulator, GntR family [Nocardioides scoriae]
MPPSAPAPLAVGHTLGEAVLRPVRGQHAFESCVEQLATAIRLGAYPRGSVLPPERELAERMGVSRATLREAMAALREAGLVETRRGRGGGTVVIKRPDLRTRTTARQQASRRAGWLDALDFRRVVEPGACALAATRAAGDPGAAAGLEDALAAVHAAGDPGSHRQADSRLHLHLAALSGSDRLMEAVTSVQASLDEMLRAIPSLETNIAHSHRQHDMIVRAVLAGDGPRARRAMEHHCDDTAALLRGLLG